MRHCSLVGISRTFSRQPMLRNFEVDDLDTRRVEINWKKEVASGSFGVIFAGTLQDDGGNTCDIVVKVSAFMQHVTKTSEDALNQTLRCVDVPLVFFCICELSFE